MGYISDAVEFEFVYSKYYEQRQTASTLSELEEKAEALEESDDESIDWSVPLETAKKTTGQWCIKDII